MNVIGGGYDYILDDETGKIKPQFINYNISISDTPPSNPKINDIWIDISGST
jgi:hypothetical protein